MTRPLIYISGPLTCGESLDKAAVNANIRRAAETFDKLQDLGLSPIVPHLTWYLQEDFGIHLSHDTWIELDYAIVARCDALLRIGGESKGADMEVAFACENNIPVFYSLNELVNHFAGRVA